MTDIKCPKCGAKLIGGDHQSTEDSPAFMKYGCGTAMFATGDVVCSAPCLEHQLATAEAKLRLAEDALTSIFIYGGDSLSGSADTNIPSDKKWYRSAVVEMRNRAAAAISAEIEEDKP